MTRLKLKPEKLFTSYLVVDGVGEFPIDMLRYEHACPLSEKDSHAIERAGEKRRVALMLRTYNTDPTPGRWQSFGWQVIGWFADRGEAIAATP